jgi:hypothetical protein
MVDQSRLGIEFAASLGRIDQISARWESRARDKGKIGLVLASLLDGGVFGELFGPGRYSATQQDEQ